MAMINSRRRQERGQASVEAALGILVFISVLVFGIRFAEMGFLSIKVLEAEANTRWDATAMKTSLPPNDFTLRDATIASAAGGVGARYADLDGRASTSAGTSATQVFVHVDDLTLDCTAETLVPLDLPATLTPVFSNGNTNGSISCRGQATMELLDWFPVNFIDQGPGGIFTVPNADPAGTKICGVGRAWGGTCQGRIAMLLGDWGLAEGAEANECPLGDNPCTDLLLQNKSYYDSVKRAYDVAMSGASTAGTALAAWTTGASPIDENQFWMSFRGEIGAPPRQAFEETVPGQHFMKDPNWVVTPGGQYNSISEYKDAYNDRTNCFLGLKCDD